MPSLWKKQKGNRISRLFADLQTGPKRGGSLVVETGFPTSLIDLFVKNRDKLKKPKSKHHKSNMKKKTNEEDVDEQHRFPNLPSVSDSSVSASGSEFDVSSCSVVENCQENVAQIDKNGLFVDDCVAHENTVVDMHYHRDSCENGSDEEKRKVFEVSNSSYLVLMSILLGTVVFAMVLYTKRWFLAVITSGFLLLMLLEYVGKPCFGLLKPCENVVSMSILKGALVVGVALYTKWFVVGITIGASLLILLEYAGNSACALFKPCQDLKRKLQGILPHWCNSKQRREFGIRIGRRGVLTRSLLIGSRREVRKGGDNDRFSSSDSDQDEVGSEDISSRGIEPEVGSDHVSNKDGERAFEDDGEAVFLKGGIEQGSGDSSTLVNGNSFLVEEESPNKPMYEILDHELKDSKYPKSLNLSGPVRYIDLVAEKKGIEGREKGCEDSELSELVNHDVSELVKCKKNKKFWKKFVPKNMHKKKKHKHERENNAAYTPDGSQDTETDLEEDDGQEEGEQEISEEEGSTTTSSVEEDECGVDDLEVANTCLTEMLQLDNRLSKPCEMVKERDGNLKYLTTMMIPLTGLIGGRMFAVGLTVICCLVFKMARG